jgi:regulator of protease activity HflC (stomatin/prohibitin superfamily)
LKGDYYMVFIVMIFLVAGLIAIAVAALGMRPKEADEGTGRANDRRAARAATGGVGAVVAGLSLLLLFFISFTVVDAGEVGVEVRFGEVQGTRSEGWHIVNPFSNVVMYPTRLVESTYTDVEDEGDKQGFDAIQAFSKENAAVFVDLTVLWSVDPAMADTVYRTVKDQYKETLVRPITRSATRDCVAQFDFDVARTSERPAVAQCIVEQMEQQLAAKGIIVESIQLRGMRADAALQASIEAKLKAANVVKEAEFKRQQAEVDKETAIIQAEAQADSAVVAAEGTALAVVIRAEATAEAIEIEAEAQARANSDIQASLDAEILELREIEAIAAGGGLIVMGTDTTPLINLP